MSWGLLTLGLALQLGVILRWWQETAVAPVGLRLLIALGALAMLVGLAQLARRLAHTRNPIAGALPAALTLLILLLTAEALLRAYQVPPGLIPTPTRVVITLGEVREVLWRDAQQTVLKSALVGYAIGTVLGVMSALLVSRFRFLERGFLPYATLFSSVPIVALAPVLVKIMGIDWPSKAAICAITVYFPVVINTFRGLTEVNPLALELMRAYAASEVQQYRWLRWPNALPFLFNALKLGATLAMIGAIVGEFFGANGRGLGFRIQIEAGRFGFDIVWAAIIIASLAGIAWYSLIAWLERRFTGWHASFRSG